MNSPAYDIAQILDSSPFSLGDYGVDLFASRMPETPNACVSIYDTGGFEPESGYAYGKPTVMVKIRNPSYQAGYAKADAIKNALHNLTEQVQSSVRYVAIWCMGDINSVGVDDNNRSILTVNFRIHRQPV